MVFPDYGAQPDSPGMGVGIDSRIPGVPVLFEDDSLLVVDKPAGMLSQPGRTESDSLVSRVLEACPGITGPSLVHRLDMDTSGLLILAKNRAVHRQMQQQFEKRQVHKRYCAVLDAPPVAMGGRIHLPIRPDIDNRPSQIVCWEHGKPSTTVWCRLNGDERGRVVFYPVTGRTHQLRLHAVAGLGVAIQGDRLYGKPAQRMMLHADRISFLHPLTGRRIDVESSAPF